MSIVLRIVEEIASLVLKFQQMTETASIRVIWIENLLLFDRFVQTICENRIRVVEFV